MPPAMNNRRTRGGPLMREKAGLWSYVQFEAAYTPRRQGVH